MTGRLIPKERLQEAGVVYEEPVVGDEPQSLLDMRLVCSRPAGPGETYQQKEYRKHLQKNRRAFMAERAKLESDLIAARAKAPKGIEKRDTVAGPIEPSYALAHARKWLEEYRAGKEPGHDADRLAGPVQGIGGDT